MRRNGRLGARTRRATAIGRRAGGRPCRSAEAAAAAAADVDDAAITTSLLRCHLAGITRRRNDRIDPASPQAVQYDISPVKSHADVRNPYLANGYSAAVWVAV